MRTFILSLLFITLASSAAVNYGAYDNTVPSYTYPVYLNAGDKIVANLSWPNSQDLDIYLYQQGQDLLSRSTWLAR